VSYDALADQLERIARRVREHEGRLDGLKLAAAADRLTVTARKFSGLLDAALRGMDPDAVRLRELLESETARAALDGKALRLLAKKAAGKSLTVKATDAPQDARKRFFDLAVAQGRAREAAAAVRQFLEAEGSAGPPPDDREAVLAEVWKLGALSGADLELAKARLLRNDRLLRAMAGYSFVRTSPRSTPAGIFAAVVKFARRVNENVS
jgi:hypothetical protein